MDSTKKQAALAGGRAYLRFVVSMYNLQFGQNRHFLHEHPAYASSRKEPSMQRLLKHPGVGTTVSDQCQYGLYSQAPDGRIMLVRKPTQWASSSPRMLDRLSKRCPGDHHHQPLEGGRANNAAYYPPTLIRAILRGMRDESDFAHSSQEEVAPDVAACMSHNSSFAYDNMMMDWQTIF